MNIAETLKLPRAKAVIQHSRPYDYDEKTGLFLYRVVDEVVAHNILTDAGRVAIHTYIYGTSAQRSSASLGTGLNFIALSNDSGAPVAGDTALATEISGNGLNRVQGTVTLPTGSGTTTTIQTIFTFTGVSSQAVQKTALFDAGSAGKMAHEILFSVRTLFQNDTVSVAFSISAA